MNGRCLGLTRIACGQGNTPLEVYQNRLNAFSHAVDGLDQAFAEIGQVVGDDGRPLVDARGADHRSCLEWRKVLNKIDEELIVWARISQRLYGTASAEASIHDIDAQEPDSAEREDPYADSYDTWEQPRHDRGEQPTS